MERQTKQNIDLKTQVLNDFLVHRREAIRLKNLGEHWMGLDEFRTLMSGVPLSKENYAKADEVIKEIDKIESDSYRQLDGYCMAIRSLGYYQHKYRNRVARKVFNSILRRITQILQSEGYFDVITQKYGPPMTEIDKITPIEA